MQADSQQINDFRTVMTGELHHLLLNHSLIGAGLPPQENSADAFTAGLERGLNTPAILPQLLKFAPRMCWEHLPAEQVSEFLSGLLIGAEVASMRDYVAHQHAITLVAGTSLTARYQQAFQAMGCDVTAVAGDTAFPAGVRSIAHAVAN
ncbi:2-dehydro-3-deoxygalactonokinase [Escherichia coli]